MTNSNKTLDERYLDWLYKNIGPLQNRNPARSYWLLAVTLYKKECVWFVANDDNRMEDGKELREDFLAETAIEYDQEWMDEGCSMLEMLVALSRRCAFEADEDAFEWFWVLIDNLGLRPFVDEEFSDDYNVDVDLILDCLINRTYKADGRGGLFPLRHPKCDQRKVELWYQMGAYLNEANTM
jgi:hypothetical protein